MTKSGSSPKELAMIEGFKGSRIRGFKGNALKLQRPEGLAEIVSTMSGGLSDNQGIPEK